MSDVELVEFEPRSRIVRCLATRIVPVCITPRKDILENPGWPLNVHDIPFGDQLNVEMHYLSMKSCHRRNPSTTSTFPTLNPGMETRAQRIGI